MSSGKVFLGLLAGFAAGTLLGMLFAPHNCDTENGKHFWSKGKEVDERDEKFNDFIEDIAEKFEDLKEEIAVDKSKAK
ncbi:hypothetical protein SAMN06265379_101146 [Saccharicrinis carchari]|uniref:Gas vesicle protein n=1 Tax=Saccharicrinis carchari TaxID=1168039 RepID=A0A521AHH8_SACCC|nr:YtxH domain-containing protein [Saccharicrinis carchari]SMO34262.1 hypothetical protein SAMN06265379_101146 [Saccharicrinis carchari]